MRENAYIFERNQRVPNLRSPLAFVPQRVLIPAEIEGTPVYLHEHVAEIQRHSGPDNPQWKIPRSEWPSVLQRVEQGEMYRQIAKGYGVSYEAVRRVVRAARRKE